MPPVIPIFTNGLGTLTVQRAQSVKQYRKCRLTSLVAEDDFRRAASCKTLQRNKLRLGEDSAMSGTGFSPRTMGRVAAGPDSSIFREE